ncbi:hypothetical protein LC1Hm_0081 [Halomicrobium sp. LC1Hm]|nr:hypothetical protein LC1Hm_0081 [Halomicrobium sp. LC1Hm]
MSPDEQRRRATSRLSGSGAATLLAAGARERNTPEAPESAVLPVDERSKSGRTAGGFLDGIQPYIDNIIP